MKLLIDKNNNSRFTIKYKIVQDDFKFDENEYQVYGNNAKICKFKNVIFQNGNFEYQPHERDGIVCEFGQKKVKMILQFQGDKIINRFPFDSNLEIEKGILIVKGIFAYQAKTKSYDNVKKKYETNLRCQIIDKIDIQIQQLMKIKTTIDFQ